MNTYILKQAKKRYNTVIDALNKNDVETLKEYDLKYFAEIISANSKRVQLNIEFKKNDLAELKKELAEYNKMANKLKALS